MSLPERRDLRSDQPVPKTGIRPRPIHSRDGATDEEGERDGLLHFSCPACLRMMSGKNAGPSQCPHCKATVTPPQLVRARLGKAVMMPPAKTGRLK